MACPPATVLACSLACEKLKRPGVKCILIKPGLVGLISFCALSFCYFFPKTPGSLRCSNAHRSDGFQAGWLGGRLPPSPSTPAGKPVARSGKGREGPVIVRLRSQNDVQVRIWMYLVLVGVSSK